MYVVERTDGKRVWIDYTNCGTIPAAGMTVDLLVGGPQIFLEQDLKILTSEDYIQMAYICWVKMRLEKVLPEARWIHHIPNGGERTMREGSKMKRLGVRRGVPDIFWPYPNEAHFGLYIEFKDKGNVQKDEQSDFEVYAKHYGYDFHLAFNPFEAAWLTYRHACLQHVKPAEPSIRKLMEQIEFELFGKESDKVN